jgi:hypothetical protein
LARLKYFLTRIKESPLDKTLLILFIRLKKIIYELYYYKLFYSFLKPKKLSNKFIGLDNFKLDFLKSIENLQVTIPNKFIKDIEENKFDCLGYGKLNFSNANVWNSDSVHKYQWPNKYFNKIDFVKKSVNCDVKIPWEINRLQFLTNISLQYLKTKNINLINQYQTVIENWISINRPGYGIPWTCNMEVSIRVINLITSFIIVYDKIDNNLKKKIKISILEHYVYIKSFPEISDVPGNHYLSNLTAEYFCSYFIYGNDNSITKSALDNFFIEASNQFKNDGCHFENATIYHRLCLDFVAIVLALSSRIDFNKKLFNVFSKGINFCNSISSDFILPIIGDADSGNVYWFGNDCRNYKYLNNYFKYLNGENLTNITQECKILIALNGSNFAKQKIKKLHSESFIGNISGFSVNKSKNFTMTMRYGNQGMKGRASHDHDDAQNISLLHKGKDILIDEGCKSYSLDPEIRKIDILSSGHNGLKLLDHERYEIKEGSVISSIKGAFTCHETIIDHNSFLSRLKTKNNYQFRELNRKILFNKVNVFKICDSWKCFKLQNLEINWRFNSIIINQKKINIKTNSITFEVRNKDNKILVEISSDSKIKCEIFDFDYGFMYGANKKRKGIKIIILNSKQGNINTRFEILS